MSTRSHKPLAVDICCDGQKYVRITATPDAVRVEPVSAEAWEAIEGVLVRQAHRHAVSRGRKLRPDWHSRWSELTPAEVYHMLLHLPARDGRIEYRRVGDGG